MNRRIKQKVLCNTSKKLRGLKFDTNNIEKAKEIETLQNEVYKRFLFYKGINEAMSRR